jgi:hypothetical protein
VTSAGASFIFKPEHHVQQTEVLLELLWGPRNGDYLIFEWVYSFAGKQFARHHVFQRPTLDTDLLRATLAFLPDPTTPEHLQLRITGRYRSADVIRFECSLSPLETAIALRLQYHRPTNRYYFERLNDDALRRLRGQEQELSMEETATLLSLLDQTKRLDLTAAGVPNFNLVDGTTALVTEKSSPFILFKGYNPGTWFFAPRWGRLATNSAGRPAFTVSKKVHNKPDGSKETIGGVLSFMLELVYELPSLDEQRRWRELIAQFGGVPAGTPISFQPMRLYGGRMTVHGIGKYAAPDQVFKDISVGAASTIGFAIELTGEGADHFYQQVGNAQSVAPQIAVMCSFNYDYMLPQCSIRALGSKQKTYDYFSINAKARASYFGLVNGSAEYSQTRAELKQTGGLDVDVVGTPPQGVDLGKLLDGIYASFVKICCQDWIVPDSTPVTAPEPGGFFGGASVNLKQMHFDDQAQFTETVNFEGIRQEVHQVSFNFEQQLSSLDPKYHCVLEQDDIKVPFLLTVSQSSKVSRYALAATYTTAAGPIQVVMEPIDARTGGIRGGVIQWPAEGLKPTSANLAITVDFVPPDTGYVFEQVLRIPDSGVSSYFQADVFTQDTEVFLSLGEANATGMALFEWQWDPPQGGGPMPRPPHSGHIMLKSETFADPNNVPSCRIQFGLRPDDWKPDGNYPRIRVALRGISGSWAKKPKVTGTIDLFQSTVVVEWDGVHGLSNQLSVPELLIERRRQWLKAREQHWCEVHALETARVMVAADTAGSNDALSAQKSSDEDLRD